MSGRASLSGGSAVILHRSDEGILRLVRQLSLLDLSSEVRWSPLEAGFAFDLVLVDADQGWDGLLPWEGRESPVPVVALLGSEAPGRLAWAIAHGAGAIIPKPITASAVFPALGLALAAFEERRAARTEIETLRERLRLRPVVHGAVRAVMASGGLTEDQAYRCMRRAAMRDRVTVEQIAADVLTGRAVLPEAS